MDLSHFYKDKKVFITGHTGFKGTWLCTVLIQAGAKITGYSLEPPTEPSLFKLANLESKINHIYGDIRDLELLKKSMLEAKPEIVIHMAAQPLVRESYTNPVYTYETNVIGTVNLLEAARKCNSVKSVVNVTTDKVYYNDESGKAYREDDVLNGFDPYSNSKSCSELVTSSYKKSFFDNTNIAVSTCRAGNVIGGGDFAKDRIIPDCVRAVLSNNNIIIRNPNSIRPYQHVLDPLLAYLIIGQKQYEDFSFAGSYNIGPNESDCLTTKELAIKFCDKWNKKNNTNIKCIFKKDDGPHEANYLKLDCNKFKTKFRWKPLITIDQALDLIVEFVVEYAKNSNIDMILNRQINKYMT